MKRIVYWYHDTWSLLSFKILAKAKLQTLQLFDLILLSLLALFLIGICLRGVSGLSTFYSLYVLLYVVFGLSLFVAIAIPPCCMNKKYERIKHRLTKEEKAYLDNDIIIKSFRLVAALEVSEGGTKRNEKPS